MKRGAVDFLPKPLDRAQVLDAIDCSLHRDERRREARAVTQQARERLNRLTPCEREVCDELLKGRHNICALRGGPG